MKYKFLVNYKTIEIYLLKLYYILIIKLYIIILFKS